MAAATLERHDIMRFPCAESQSQGSMHWHYSRHAKCKLIWLGKTKI